MNDETRAKLLRLAKAGRQIAKGTADSIWDPIFDAEALAKGERTSLSGTPAEVAAVCIDILERRIAASAILARAGDAEKEKK